jgi:hypothetical protein
VPAPLSEPRRAAETRAGGGQEHEQTLVNSASEGILVKRGGGWRILGRLLHGMDIEHISDHDLERYHLGMVVDEAELAPLRSTSWAVPGVLNERRKPHALTRCGQP